MSYYQDAGQIAYQEAEMLGRPVLFTMEHIDRYSLPKNAYCYGLRGTEKEQTRPVAVKPGTDFYHAGTVILAEPLKFGIKGETYLRGRFAIFGQQTTLTEFLAEEGVAPEWRAYAPRPISPEEADLLFSGDKVDERYGCVGHVRADFDNSNTLWHSWWPRHTEWETPGFKEELDKVVNELRECGMLHSFDDLSKYCYAHPEARLDERHNRDAYGFKVETEGYQYYFRLTPVRGDYQLYLYTYDKARQQLVQAEDHDEGQVLQMGGQQL